MNSLVRKRTVALAIDIVISNGVEVAAKPILRKKIENEFFHAIVTQTVLFWGLEYIQLRLSGQTIGHRVQGIKLESVNGGELTSGQIARRLLHRDFVAPVKYWQNREEYNAYQGTKLPHDTYAHTIMREK